VNSRAYIIALFVFFPLVAAPAESDADAGSSRSWNFKVSLGEKPIGTHTFVLLTHKGDSKLLSSAHFAARIALVYRYHYDHDAVEQWQGDSLIRLDARTDDDGKKSSVHVHRANNQLQAIGGSALGGCEMTFAYWNVALLKQSHLLNAQTGECEAVIFNDFGYQPLEVQGRTTNTHRYTLTSASLSMDLWYSEKGDWLALDARTPRGSTLHYRLE
jgi:hypothetical protein